jgi:hypothetical protein
MSARTPFVGTSSCSNMSSLDPEGPEIQAPKCFDFVSPSDMTTPQPWRWSLWPSLIGPTCQSMTKFEHAAARNWSIKVKSVMRSKRSSQTTSQFLRRRSSRLPTFIQAKHPPARQMSSFHDVKRENPRPNTEVSADRKRVSHRVHSVRKKGITSPGRSACSALHILRALECPDEETTLRFCSRTCNWPPSAAEDQQEQYYHTGGECENQSVSVDSSI